MTTSKLYSLNAFDNAVNFLMPEIKIMNDVTKGTGYASRPEQIKIVASHYFLIDHDDLSEKQVEALEVVRSVGKTLKAFGTFKYGDAEFDV